MIGQSSIILILKEHFSISTWLFTALIILILKEHFSVSTWLFTALLLIQSHICYLQTKTVIVTIGYISICKDLLTFIVVANTNCTDYPKNWKYNNRT